MSDPTPEDLYDALRKRLADYGQEPPPGLWAGIRQQLPPPVAVPRRRRWRASLALLSLLFVVAGLATWQWQRAGHSAAQTGVAAQQTSTATERNRANNSRVAASAANAPTGPDAGAVASGASGTATLPTSGAEVPSAAQRPELASDINDSDVASNNSASKTLKSKATDSNSATQSVRPATAVAATITGRVARRKRALALAEVTSGASVARAHRRLRRPMRQPGLGQEPTTAARPGSEAALSAARAMQPAAAGMPQTAATGTPSTSSTREPLVAADVAAASTSRAAVDKQPSSAAATVPTVPGLAPSPSATESADSQATPAVQWDWLALRLAALQLPAGAAVGAPRAVEVPPLPPVLPTVVSRWAVQLVAGPGLTYRQLRSDLVGYPTALAMPAPSSPLTSAGNIVRSPITTSSSAAQLERPALGYGAQLSLRRTLTPHWTLSGGLGYAEYATQLALRQVNASQITRANYDFFFLDSLSRTDGTTIRQRDTYRFLTVPLRVGYAWTTGPRWQVGLLGGVDAAIYLGGTSTEGSACACQPQTWGASGSPYRSLSLAASLGAEVRYRLAGPWQLLAQPTASYFFTPLAKPVSGYSIRHLLGATALLGVSYDLP